ncbi:hypothetical protein [Flavobacterium agrisoli]|uniref:Uncharacterized protein n=1 Tax=Flavobacterium agrisoli TaxID=2793066 RepID=A0A934PKS2_9FLAO|nr:hypothetical protein [Flavobacterium agrisoli]MBK0369987.1 hypothetical protein [Flavobacterium agrisoli]
MGEIIKKLKFKDVAVAIDAPENYQNKFLTHEFALDFKNDVTHFNVLVFIKDKSSFLNFMQQKMHQIAYDAVLWFAYPKGTSKVKTDINRDSMW